MLIDYECELTDSAGQSFTTTAGADMYGNKPYDFKAGGVLNNPGVGEPLYAFVKSVSASYAGVTALSIAIIASTGTTSENQQFIIDTQTFLSSVLLTDKVICLGAIKPVVLSQSGAKYLNAQVSTSYTTGVTLKIWLAKGTDVAPYNKAVQL